MVAIYERARNNGAVLGCTCIGISIGKWESLMEGSVKADGSKIRKIIRKFLPSLFDSLALSFYNPYESKCLRTKTHLIYVHSGVEYFIKVP